LIEALVLVTSALAAVGALTHHDPRGLFAAIGVSFSVIWVAAR
jgi:hypothetical protein